jgi:hypothetical protein
MLKIPEKTQYFNNLLLSVSWDNVKFDSPEFKNGLILDDQLFTSDQIKFFELLLAIVPEWKRVIGCKQHKTHSFCLDIHILSVIKKITEQGAFCSLDDYYKLIILWGGLLHDIEKEENVVDPEHPFKGAEKAKLILNRLEFNEYFINSVYTLVKYHPVIGLMASDKINLSVADFINKIGDEKIVDIFIIFSIADIKAVKSDDAFYNDNIDNNIKRIHSEIKTILQNNN